MKTPFKSNNFVFRQTIMGEAFARLGAKNMPMVREPKCQAKMRDRNDERNMRPSRDFYINVASYLDGSHNRDPNTRVLIPLNQEG